VGLLDSPTLESRDVEARLTEEAKKAGISLVLTPLETPFDEAAYRRAFAALVERAAEAVYFVDHSEFFAKRQLIVALAQEHRLPAIYGFRDAVAIGGLMAYTIDYADQFAHAADAVDQIFKGIKPSEIPFYQASKFELAINLKAAKALGIDIPTSLLAQADEVFE